jgi:ABC-type nickel/cobalt efflux system permease component RcnA
MVDGPLRAMRLRTFGLSLCSAAAVLLLLAIVLMLRDGASRVVTISLVVVGLALNVVGFVLLQRGKKVAGDDD